MDKRVLPKYYKLQYPQYDCGLKFDDFFEKYGSIAVFDSYLPHFVNKFLLYFDFFMTFRRYLEALSRQDKARSYKVQRKYWKCALRQSSRYRSYKVS